MCCRSQGRTPCPLLYSLDQALSADAIPAGDAMDQNVGFDGSGHGADDLGIGGKAAKRLLGAGYAVVDADLKDAPTRPPQYHLRIWSDLADEVRRLTGARFIVSLTAVLDFNAHRLPSHVCEVVVVPQGSTPVSPGTLAGQGPTSVRQHLLLYRERGSNSFKCGHPICGVQGIGRAPSMSASVYSAEQPCAYKKR